MAGRTGTVSQAYGDGVAPDTAAREPAADAVGSIEVHGIDFIPLSERHGGPAELFWIWAASNMTLSYVIGGSILITLGLSFWQALVTTLAAAVFWIAVGVVGISGPPAGTATMVVSRSAFGLRGNLAPTFLSWLTVVGWQAVTLVLGAFALFALAEEVGITATTGVKAVLLGLLALMTYAVAVLGHATIVYLQRLFTIALAILLVGVAVQVIPDADWSHPSGELAGSSGLATMLIGLMVLAAFSVGWTNYAADYTRYMPRETSRRGIVTWTLVGGIATSVVITLIGVLAATATDLTDPIGGFKPLLASWYYVPFLIVVVGGALTNNFLNTYTSGLTLQALGLRVQRWKTVILDGAIATAAAVYAIFFHDFTATFIEFLSLQIIWLAPWCAVYCADMWLTRMRYSEDLLRSRGGRYWYTRGVNLYGFTSWCLGAVAAFLVTNSTRWQSPISTDLLGGADLSAILGAAVAGAAYLVFARRIRGSDATDHEPRHAGQPASGTTE
ncbi:MAG TPA: cytosine permease [Thermoleophilaceae bacterium]|nr:cytosine permease [Thermoleophilaceae bacterium]